jgi:hypothetical protein
MEELLKGLILWTKGAACAAIVTAGIVLIAHWDRLSVALADTSAAPAKQSVSEDCECPGPATRHVRKRPDNDEHAENDAPVFDDEDKAAPFIGTPAVNIQPGAGPGVGVGSFAGPPAPPIVYGGPEYQFGVTVVEKKHHRWPRRMIGGIGRGIGKIFGFRRH